MKRSDPRQALRGKRASWPKLPAREVSTQEDFYDWLDSISGDRFSRRLAFQKGGNLAALHDALVSACSADEQVRKGELSPTDQVPVQRWVIDALLNQIPDRIQQQRRWRNRYRSDLVDWKRFMHVYYRRLGYVEGPKLKPRQVREQKAALLKRAKGQFGNQVVTWLPYPWHQGAGHGPEDWSVFQAVQRELAGTVYAGSWQTIRASWQRVLTALKRGEAWRYYPSRSYFKGHSHTAEDMATF